ncbi:heterokaryon incompatibility protein-domain-containing protein, partial [Podospora aff. communis PSN243]
MAIRLVDTHTLSLETFSWTLAPNFVILSHTWEPDDEVSYQEMAAASDNVAHPARWKSGFRKIEKTCELARAEGYYFVWIDTCCIDKSSSAELSEAINSMFRWYRGATICYAYLADLPAHRSRNPISSSLQEQLPRCRWFTRGWCLQELIAPRDIVFFNSSWESIGRKTDPNIKRLLSQITRIDEKVLTNPAVLPSLPVAQKMSWAADRETTRPEDMSYCLLGIFDINMPMLYGEGTKAFQRLQEEIIKRTNDLSIFAWVDGRTPEQVPGTPFLNLFAASPRDFLNCRYLKPESPAVSRNNNFTLTNNGLLLSGARFTLDFDHGIYFLRIGSTPTSTRYLALKRISSKIFFRTAIPDPGIVMALKHSPFGPDDVFIPPTIGPIAMAFYSDSNLDLVQIRSHREGRSFQFELHISILDVFPKESWDASRLTFLQDATNPLLKGYIKFHGPVFESQVGRTFHKPPSQNFYLVWHLKHIDEGRSLVSFM